MDIFLDIETLPCADPDLIAAISERVKAPGSMKKHETIAKWEQEERPQAVADAVARTSLDGTYGRVCVIGWAIDDAEPSVLVTEDERDLLATFYGELSAIIEPPDAPAPVVRWVGHNLAGFDLPFLRKRSVINGVRPPVNLERVMRAKPWDEWIGDTMLMWDSDREKRISLDTLCRVLSIPSPKADGIDGSKVAELFRAGEYARLGEYCAADVVAARRCYRAMTFQ